ncbi:MAG: RHS repeat-associated core domain-containing protein [Patescibacteria group bacterium]
MGDQLVATIEATGSTTTPYYVHTDHLNSTSVVTDSTGAQSELLDYFPYGSQRISSGAYTNQKQYIGQHYDEETELSYLNARYYDGARGQFTSQDPVFWEIGQSQDGMKALFDPQSQNSYSYARNNPIVNKDPEGRYWESAFDVAMLAWSLNDYKENPGFLNGLGVVADGASLVLPIPAIVGGIRHGDDAYKALRVAQDVSKANNWGNAYSLVDHTIRHGADFGLKPNDVAGYAKASNSFISRADAAFKQGNTRYDSFLGRDGKSYFFDTKTSTFGVKNADGTTATAYKPKGGDPQKAADYWNKQKSTKAKK